MARPEAIVEADAESAYHAWMIYGEPGVGKTIFAASSPECLLLSSASDNPQSAARHGLKPKIWTVRDWSDMEEAEEYIRHEGCKEFKWVWLDTVTLFQELGLDNIMIDLHAEKPHRQIYLPDRGEYGQNMMRLGQWCRRMKAQPINFGLTAHTLRTEDDEGRVLYMPYIQGKGMPEKISGYMSLVGYLRVRSKEGKQERTLITNKQARYYAKDSYGGVFGGRVLDPTVPKMLSIIDKSGQNKPAAKTTTTTRRRTRSAA